MIITIIDVMHRYMSDRTTKALLRKMQSGLGLGHEYLCTSRLLVTGIASLSFSPPHKWSGSQALSLENWP